jgi:ABC-2 type transport system permease protein
MTKYVVLVQRSVREALRTPEALLPTLFIPLFFLVVNVGQAARIFPTALAGVAMVALSVRSIRRYD